MIINEKELKAFLDKKVAIYNQPSFIKDDPVSIPRRYSKKQDIEIAGFFAAIFAWGNRKSIIQSATRLMELMDNAPYDFIMNTDWNENEEEFSIFEGFVHRTFNEMDLWHLLNFLRYHYWFMGEESLETAFTKGMGKNDPTIENGLKGFYNYVFSYDQDAEEERHCRKHIANPEKKSTCKRLNMFLRWMVRQDNKGVDFGIWKTISPSQLICPIDLHVARVARRLSILERKQTDWQAALELTHYLRTLDKDDPVKYDFALFGLGVVEKF
jgi:uncharacterized protein (TIGR02757 family)